MHKFCSLARERPQLEVTTVLVEEDGINGGTFETEFDFTI